MGRLMEFMPFDPSMLLRVSASGGQDPDFILRHCAQEMLKDWGMWFDEFLKSSQLIDYAKLVGLKVKSKHTIVEPWPCQITAQTTKKEFDVLLASGLTGHERYMEFERSGAGSGG